MTNLDNLFLSFVGLLLQASLTSVFSFLIFKATFRFHKIDLNYKTVLLICLPILFFDVIRRSVNNFGIIIYLDANFERELEKMYQNHLFDIGYFVYLFSVLAIILYMKTSSIARGFFYTFMFSTTIFIVNYLALYITYGVIFFIGMSVLSSRGYTN